MPEQKKLINAAVVRHIADIARLKLTEAEIKKFEKDLTDILGAFKSLDEVDVKNVEPSFQPQPIEDVIREDKIKPPLDHEKALNLSRNTQKGFYKGPKAV
jgi:aspartyl-tRNA(Asn)/glutamyl-tRNA(Gln) amidotransferase subunit C